ncbi:MAG: RluA family pseudouridine synthase [Pontiellaceae bacterium]|nr:RluA family pseudouridine synthase [Pontiellaceae bacterium]MBN2784568.1 RluA family pseudouridine synthase [Pontiellaceae bacterium]
MKSHSRTPRRHRSLNLEILFEDRDILVVNKATGLLTWSPHRDQQQTAERILTNYLRKGSARSRLRAFTVHRLDRETSGLLVFAKSERVQQQLKNNWRDVEKRYFAVVHGLLEQKSGTFSCYLAEDRDQFVYVTKDKQAGKWAECGFRVLKESANRSAVEVELQTGRKNQIRVQFADAGYPILGDRKYGRKEDRCERMALHAMHLEFDHPFSGRRMVFDSPPPENLLCLVGGMDLRV